MHHYSPAKAAFFSEADFGPRMIAAIDDEAQTRALAALTAREAEIDPAHRAADDMQARIDAERAELLRNPPSVPVPNPDCRLPEDAFPVSAAQHAAMLDAINAGKIITVGPDNAVSFTDPGVSAEAVMKAARRERDRALEASDWTMVADVPLSPTAKAEWRKYRKKLRDIPAIVAGLLKSTDAAVVLGAIDELVTGDRPS